MNRPAIIKAAYFAVLATDGDPSRRAVAEMCRRICGKGFRHDEVLAVLTELKRGPLGDQSGTKAGPQTVRKTHRSGTTRGTRRDPTCAPHKVLDQEEKVQTDQDQSATSGEESWVTELRVSANAISGKTMRDMTLDDRIVCGRYFAYRFANCTKSESNNVKHGASATKAFAQMADAKRFRDMTLRAYADEATVYRERVMKGAPFHDPFAVRTMLEPEPEPAGRR